MSLSSAKSRPLLGRRAKWLLLISVALFAIGVVTEIVIHRSVTNSLLSAAILGAVIVAYDRLRFEGEKIAEIRDRTRTIHRDLEDVEVFGAKDFQPPVTDVKMLPAAPAAAPNESKLSEEVHRLIREHRYSLPTEWMSALHNLLNALPAHGSIMFIGEQSVLLRLQEFVGKRHADRFVHLDLKSEDGGRRQSQEAAEWSALLIQPFPGLAANITASNISKYAIRWMPSESRILTFESPDPVINTEVIQSLEQKTATELAPFEVQGRVARHIAIYDLEEI